MNRRSVHPGKLPRCIIRMREYKSVDNITIRDQNSNINIGLPKKCNSPCTTRSKKIFKVRQTKILRQTSEPSERRDFDFREEKKRRIIFRYESL